ncbi:hypothetical protein F2P81_018706 [Scophthalmus maximus]|uniref:Uncharacterized protein n=1 Tax=Scophthalmus maximus TaxID=52904 RepID=A0A6A4SEM9_SCOMX|nr:hypothetical protein F2P81_018706 [Scophthalmus maximus]
MAPVSRRKDASRWPRMSSTFWAVVLLTALLVLYCVVSLVICGCTFCNQTPPYEIRYFLSVQSPQRSSPCTLSPSRKPLAVINPSIVTVTAEHGHLIVGCGDETQRSLGVGARFPFPVPTTCSHKPPAPPVRLYVTSALLKRKDPRVHPWGEIVIMKRTSGLRSAVCSFDIKPVFRKSAKGKSGGEGGMIAYGKFEGGESERRQQKTAADGIKRKY